VVYIAIVGGSPGTGKTLQSFLFPKPILSLDMENRQGRCREDNFTGSDKEEISIIECLELYPPDHERAYYIDAVKTLNRARKEIRHILTGKKKPATIIMDGLSELRAYAVDEWLQRKRTEGKKRIQPSGAGDWGEINDIVRSLIFPLINYCRVMKINLVLTCTLKDKYKDREVVGSELHVKDWMAYNVDYIYWLKASTDNKYLVECHKSPNGRMVKVITNENIVGFPSKEEVEAERKKAVETENDLE